MGVYSSYTSASASGPAGRMVSSAIELIKKSKRPIIIIGYGANDAMANVIELAESLNAPILTTFSQTPAKQSSHE